MIRFVAFEWCRWIGVGSVLLLLAVGSWSDDVVQVGDGGCGEWILVCSCGNCDINPK